MSPPTVAESTEKILDDDPQVFMLNNPSNSGPRVFLSLKLNDYSCYALADSGADISVLSSKILEFLPGVVLDGSQCVTVKGHGRSAESRTLGVVTLSVDMGGFISPNTVFHVVDECDIQHAVIVGADFMYRHYLAPSPAHGRLIYAPPDATPEFIKSPRL